LCGCSTPTTPPMAGGDQMNLLGNPGFETSRAIAIKADAPRPWGELVKRGVEILTGDEVRMPISWLPNVDAGWARGVAASYRYVTGQPGRETHSGEHALFVSSKGAVDVMSGVGFSAVDDLEHASGRSALPLNKPFPFSFYAKGHGTVRCRLYTYLVGRENYGMYKATPETFTLTDQWRQYQGVLELSDPGPMHNVLFVISVINGEAAIDDVALRNTMDTQTQDEFKLRERR